MDFLSTHVLSYKHITTTSLEKLIAVIEQAKYAKT